MGVNLRLGHIKEEEHNRPKEIQGHDRQICPQECHDKGIIGPFYNLRPQDRGDQTSGHDIGHGLGFEIFTRPL